MKIRAGMDLDGQQGLRRCPSLDEISTGPMGLLGVLETQLGLLQAEVAHADRVLQFREVLKRCDGPDRFFHQSFAVDPLGTASTLLGWRDLWHLHAPGGAWGDRLASAAPRRLRDMADLDKAAMAHVAPGLGQRLHAVGVALQSLRPRIAQLQLIDAKDDWPLAWRRIFEQLPCVASPAAQGQAQPGTVLWDVQLALQAVDQGRVPPKLTWRDDGSLRVVRCETRLLGAHWLAQHLGSGVSGAGGEPETLLCAPSPDWLDDVMVAAGQPAQGFKEPSAFRPALQVVSLVLGQLWKPVDVFGLLKFLTHPVCPVHRVARWRLAGLIARAPGMGQGPAWELTLDSIRVDCEAQDLDWAKVRGGIRTWLEHERFEPTAGAPLAAVVQVLHRLGGYFQGRMGDPDAAKRAAFGSGFAQAVAVRRAIEALALQGEDAIQPQQLLALVRQATASGQANPMRWAEVGAGRTITTPAAAVDGVQQVIWWWMEAPRAATPHPWSPSELAVLRDAGIDIPSLDSVMARTAQAWLRPVMAATERLVLMLPAPGVEVHPVWLLVASLFDKTVAPVVLALEDLLSSPAQPSLVQHPLPERQSFWQLPPQVAIPKREEESFSSLEGFVHNPSLWVLKYHAKLKPSRVLAVSEGSQLYGNLGHHLVERAVSEHQLLGADDAAFDAWFSGTLATLLAQEGAVLLMPGQQAKLAGLRQSLYAAVKGLQQQLLAAQVVAIAAEAPLNGHFAGGHLVGSADLIVTNAHGEQAIIDIKFGSQSYVDKLKFNRHLQLCTYGELMRQQSGKWPALAYFSLSSGQLLATDRTFFPRARQVGKAKDVADEGVAALWQRFLQTWQWRRDQLDSGAIAVVLDKTQDPTAPPDGLVPEVLEMSYNDYKNLSGWGANA